MCCGNVKSTLHNQQGLYYPFNQKEETGLEQGIQLQK